MPYAVKCSLNSQGAFAISGYKRFDGHFRSPQGIARASCKNNSPC